MSHWEKGRPRALAAVISAAILSLYTGCGEQAAEGGGGAGSGSAGSDGSLAGAGGGGGSGATGGGSATPEVRPHPDCDLTGKWISVQRTLTYALEGAVVQSGHKWDYWEMEQSGADAVTTRGLRCGLQVVDRSEVSTTNVGVSQALWEGEMLHSRSDGRKAVYGANESDQCYLHFEQRYLVRGATVDYFIDPEVPLQEAAEPATETTPGWEDWDGDGNPGVTYAITGVLSGELYVAQRDWNEYQGITPKGSDKFKLGVVWNTEQLSLGRNPPSMPSADSVASTEAGDNFVWFARVDGLQQWDLPEGADDLTVCARMRELKDDLLPEGN
ncbi:MAG: hypothetical protein ABIG68_14455, partial [Acidobacteriota bacterium]